MNRSKIMLIALALSILAVSGAQAQFAVPVPKSLVQTMLVKAFPRVIKSENGKILFADPEFIFLAGDRLGVRTRLSRSAETPAGKQTAKTNASGMILVSGRLHYEKKSQRFFIHKPVIDSLVMSSDDKQSKILAQDVKAYWKKHTHEPVVVVIPETPYIESIKPGIKDVIVKNNSISLMIGLP